MKYFINFLKGILVGIANLIPGVSGGTMAVSVGIYDKLISCIGNFFKNFKKTFKENMLFLIPIGLGSVFGIIAFSKLLKFLLEHYEMQTCFTFIGLILGSIPFIFNNANKKGFRKKFLISFLISFAFGSALSILEILGITGNEITNFSTDPLTLIIIILYGFIAAISMVIPGISGSFILLLLGVYSAVLGAVSSLNFLVLIPFAIGVILGIIISTKLLDYLLKHFYGYTYYAILGFIFGSIPSIFPGFTFNLSGLFSIILLIVGFISTFIISKLSKK